MLGETLQCNPRSLPLQGDVGNQYPRLFAYFPQQFGYPLLFAIAEDQVHTGHLPQLVKGHLGITTGDHDLCRRLPVPGAADQPARLGVGPGSYGAGVDQVDVRFIRKRHDQETLSTKALGHGRRFELVDLAAKCGNGYSLHEFPSIQPPPSTSSSR